MEMVLINHRIRLYAVLLISVFSTGCGFDMPFERKLSVADTDAITEEAGTPETGAATSLRSIALAEDAVPYGAQRLSLPAGSVPLPRQDYSASGEIIPYVALPNPYTSNTTPVPAEAKAIFVVASAQLKQGELDNALKKFEQLTGKYPELSGPWVKLGEIAERRDQPDVAIRHYKKAISLNENNVNAYIALGLAQRKQGLFNDAQTTYLAALRTWKDFPEAHLNLAILYDLYANEPETAQKHYEAYDFLTGKKDENARKWLVEVKNRTGISASLIDIRPEAAVMAPDGTAEANVATVK